MENLKLHRITNKDDPYLRPLWELYCNAFPEDERRNKEDFLDRLRSDHRSYYHVILKEGTFIGLIILWKLREVYYLEHFAIVPEARSNGIGGKVLRNIMEKGFTPMIGEVEPPVDDIARRRIEFYRRAGFELYDMEYMQPPYSKDKNSLKMRVIGRNFDQAKLLETIRELKEVVYQYFDE
ncbi:MAG: GNAT family N-acetyltransferase [Bacteroidales bacterium]|jgi:ribosomal protein S18 acetylase RimI-like enzyme|nr:GNAT family N-acetyltransferase [Bacteroidales bacterium]